MESEDYDTIFFPDFTIVDIFQLHKCLLSQDAVVESLRSLSPELMNAFGMTLKPYLEASPTSGL